MNKKILVVEDSKYISKIIKMTLKMDGYDVFVAENGEDGFRQAENNTFDLILTDINMPIMDGITLTLKLRQTSEYREKPIICMTTDTSDEIKTKLQNAQASALVIKPFIPESLLILIKTTLSCT